MLALIAVPLLLALIGWNASNESREAREVAAPSVDPPASPIVPASPSAGPSNLGAKFGVMSIVRSGNGFTLSGEMPDAALKDSLATSLEQAMPGAKIVDDIVVKPGVRGPEFAGLGGLFGSALDIPGFSARFDGDTVRLAGTAPSLVNKASAESSAKATWPNVAVVNDIRVVAPSGKTPAPAPTPTTRAAAPAGACATLQADITSTLRTPITFDTDGFTLQPGSVRVLNQIADKITACPAALISVVGYTDGKGGDDINGPLSASRAKSVAGALVSDGVADANITSRGAGSANPLASNDTPAGRSQNRRVEITVG